MDTEIFQFGQRGAEKIEFKDFFLISKSLLFVPYYCLFDFLRWVGIFDHSFLWHFLTKDRNFCNHWKENFLNFVKLTLHLSVVHSWYPKWPIKCSSINPYPCIYWYFRSTFKIFKCNYLSIAWTKLEKLSAHQIENFLNFSKHPNLLFLVSL